MPMRYFGAAVKQKKELRGFSRSTFTNAASSVRVLQQKQGQTPVKLVTLCSDGL